LRHASHGAGRKARRAAAGRRALFLDDYGSWPECKRAVDEYIAKNNTRADIRTVDYSGAFWRVEG
jgi:hypothetical protein